MKPFLNAIALDEGYGMRLQIMSPYEVTRDVTIPTCTSPIKYEAEGEGAWRPNNENTSENGVYDMTSAGRDSVNTYHVLLEEKVGTCRPVRLHHRDRDEERPDAQAAGAGRHLHPRRRGRLAARPGEGLRDLRGARLSPARSARSSACRCATARPIEGPDADCKRVISPEVSDAVTYMLQNVVRTGTGRAATSAARRPARPDVAGLHRLVRRLHPAARRGRGGLGPAGYNKPQYDLRNVSIGGRVFERVQGRAAAGPRSGRPR
jgi:hypothetical protein